MDERLLAAVAGIQQYAIDIRRHEERVDFYLSHVLEYVSYVKLDEYHARPAKDQKREWGEYARRFPTRTGEQKYADMIVGIKAAVANHQELHPDVFMPVSDTSIYAMARALVITHEAWEKQGGFQGHGGSRAEDFFVLLRRDGGFWNIALRDKEAKRALEAAERVDRLHKEIAGHVSAVINLVGDHPEGRPLIEDMNRYLSRTSAHRTIASSAASEAQQAREYQDAKKNAKDALRAETEIKDSLLLAAIDGLEKAQALISSIAPEPIVQPEPVIEGPELEPIAQPEPVSKGPEPQQPDITKGPEPQPQPQPIQPEPAVSANDDEVWKQAAFRADLGSLFMRLLERAGMTPQAAGSITIHYSFAENKMEVLRIE